ncbi:MAG TPA: hypothetical protein VHL11_21235, partial [Phototrophicaceae bacterium]|nr:hypothetical protein [Phototrophicaceae bacterium]
MKKFALLLSVCLLLLTSFGQNTLAAPEPDTEAFLTANFHLQSSYNHVLCVGTGCPASINTAIPCLTDGCSNPSKPYNIQSTYSTIQAASDAAVPGDLIIIMPGTYRGVDVEEKHGANNAYIHFLGWGAPGSVIVNQPSLEGPGRHHFYFIDTDYYIVQNIVFSGSTTGTGIFFSGYFSETGHFSDHIIVMGIYSRNNNTWGLHTTQVSYMVVQDSVFTGSQDEHGAYISGGGDHFLIRRNVFQGNNASGLQANLDPESATTELFYYLQNRGHGTCGITEEDADFEGPATWDEVKACYDQKKAQFPADFPDLGEFIDDGIGKDFIIEQNVMDNNGNAGGAAINLASLRQSEVRNNLVYGNHAGSIMCWDNAYAEVKGLPSSAFGCKGVNIFNNTVVEQSCSRTSIGFTNDARDMTVYNNVIACGRSDAYEISARSGDGLRSGTNYYYAISIFDSPGVITIDTDPGSGSVTGFTMPQALANFVNPNQNNWVDLS